MKRALRNGIPVLLVGAAVVAVLLQAWWTRYAFNPDGVSYLDLAGRLRAGDVGSFVQGYWSPAFPALVAAVSAVTGGAPRTMLLVAHGVSAAAVIAAMLLLIAWGLRLDRPRATVGALLALLVVTDGFPKFETVTPDLLLLACMVWLGYELLAHEGARWKVIGVVLGLAFLIKTSAWPWLLLSVPLRLWAATDAPARRRVLRSSAIAAGVAALWIVPLSLKSGRPTVGSAARLNYAWYVLGGGDDRTPDTHQGEHVAYRTAPLDSTHAVTWADYGDDDRWTYAPWSDPTAWDRGFIDRKLIPTPVASLPRWWAHQARDAFRFWLRPFLFVVVLPWGLLEWIPAFRRRRWAPDRQGIVAAALGAAGLTQFILVHAEPRLIAPYALLFGLAVMHGPPRPPVPDEDEWIRTILWPALALGGLVVAVSMTRDSFREGRVIDRRRRTELGVIATTVATLDTAGIPHAGLVVVGPAIPVMGTAYLSGAHIVAQVLPRSIGPLATIPSDARDQVLVRLFGSRTRVIWMTNNAGDVSALALPPAPLSTGTP